MGVDAGLDRPVFFKEEEGLPAPTIALLARKAASGAAAMAA